MPSDFSPDKAVFRRRAVKGYEATTIQDIVDALGMSKGAIYHHFKSKADIMDLLSSLPVPPVQLRPHPEIGQQHEGLRQHLGKLGGGGAGGYALLTGGAGSLAAVGLLMLLLSVIQAVYQPAVQASIPALVEGRTGPWESWTGPESRQRRWRSR